jgi:uncharacterized membrane protein YagU involved in acid resistance
MQRLKYLPWRSLFLTAAVTIFCTIVLSYAVGFSTMNSAIARQVLAALYTPPWRTLTDLALSTGVGAIAVYFLETLFPRIAINTNVLWTLVLCLMVVLIVKSFSPLPEGLVAASQISLLGIVLGVFLLGGKRYWR